MLSGYFRPKAVVGLTRTRNDRRRALLAVSTTAPPAGFSALQSTDRWPLLVKASARKQCGVKKE